MDNNVLVLRLQDKLHEKGRLLRHFESLRYRNPEKAYHRMAKPRGRFAQFIADLDLRERYWRRRVVQLNGEINSILAEISALRLNPRGNQKPVVRSYEEQLQDLGLELRPDWP